MALKAQNYDLKINSVDSIDKGVLMKFFTLIAAVGFGFLIGFCVKDQKGNNSLDEIKVIQSICSPVNNELIVGNTLNIDTNQQLFHRPNHEAKTEAELTEVELFEESEAELTEVELFEEAESIDKENSQQLDVDYLSVAFQVGEFITFDDIDRLASRLSYTEKLELESLSINEPDNARIELLRQAKWPETGSKEKDFTYAALNGLSEKITHNIHLTDIAYKEVCKEEISMDKLINVYLSNQSEILPLAIKMNYSGIKNHLKYIGACQL